MASFKLKWEQPRIERELFNLARRQSRAAGRYVRDEMRRQLSRPAAGQSSLPGQTPKLRTGFLRKHVRHAVSARQSKKQVTVKIGPVFRAFYAKFLQFGTRKLAARPFIDTRAVKAATEHAMRILVGKA